jgi:hypothetical protein
MHANEGCIVSADSGRPGVKCARIGAEERAHIEGTWGLPAEEEGEGRAPGPHERCSAAFTPPVPTPIAIQALHSNLIQFIYDVN